MARVGDEVLTREEVLGHVDTSRGDQNDQIRGYIASWVNSELLFQEAKVKGIEKSDAVNQQMNEIRRHITTQSYLEQYVYRDSTAMPDDTLRAYFENHGTEFFIREDVKQLNLAVFSSRQKASEFAAAIAQGASWNTAMSTFTKDTGSAAILLSAASGRYYTMHTIVPPELWKVTQSLAPGEVSFPVKTDAGSAIIQVVRTYKQGTPTPFELAKDEILQRVLLERHRKTYDTLLKTLRSRYAVQVFFPSSADSANRHD